MLIKTCDTYWVKIYLSGPLNVIEQTCREFVLSGLCLTVEPTKFIYSGGEETGAVVGLINYPKFSSIKSKILEKAKKLAMKLLEDTKQHSVLIVTPSTTTYYTKRK